MSDWQVDLFSFLIFTNFCIFPSEIQKMFCANCSAIDKYSFSCLFNQTSTLNGPQFLHLSAILIFVFARMTTDVRTYLQLNVALFTRYCNFNSLILPEIASSLSVIVPLIFSFANTPVKHYCFVLQRRTLLCVGLCLPWKALGHKQISI